MALKYAPADLLIFYMISRNLVHTVMHIMVILFSMDFLYVIHYSFLYINEYLGQNRVIC